jgi:hypothetical protein
LQNIIANQTSYIQHFNINKEKSQIGTWHTACL